MQTPRSVTKASILSIVLILVIWKIRRGWLKSRAQYIISFSYFDVGESKEKSSLYLHGLVNNVIEIPKFYGNHWTIRIYHNVSNPSEILTKAQNLPYVELVDVRDLTIEGVHVKGTTGNISE